MRTKEELQKSIDNMESILIKLSVPMGLGFILIFISTLLYIWIDSQILLRLLVSGLLIFLVSFLSFGIVRGTQRSLINELTNFEK
jgi:ABC-type transport system involved in cytochrome bd biosynthesis fused ATPase/permease subunit